MIREFIEVPLFTKRWKEIGLDDAELKKLVKPLKDQTAKMRAGG